MDLQLKILQEAINDTIAKFVGLINGEYRIYCRSEKRNGKRIKKAVLQGI